MLTTDELTALESLLQRARRDAARGVTATHEALTPGDVVQLRPGADPTWETSLMLVMQADPYKIRGQILRPHRGGCREAWASYKPPEVTRIGRAPFPEPAPDIKAWCYEPPCPLVEPIEARVLYRERNAALTQQLRDEQHTSLIRQRLKLRKRLARSLRARPPDPKPPS